MSAFPPCPSSVAFYFSLTEPNRSLRSHICRQARHKGEILVTKFHWQHPQDSPPSHKTLSTPRLPALHQPKSNLWLLSSTSPLPSSNCKAPMGVTSCALHCSAGEMCYLQPTTGLKLQTTFKFGRKGLGLGSSNMEKMLAWKMNVVTWIWSD